MTASEKWEAVVALYTARRVQYPAWRKGQTLFNVLYEVDPDVANEIHSTSLDPFFDDDRTAGLWAHLGELWL